MASNKENNHIMRTNYSIKNFKSFNNDGSTFKLSPLTLLTGCNSSGKSSVVKSLMLLDDFLSQIKADMRDGVALNLDKYKIDFTKKQNKVLGNFSKVINWNDSSDSIVLSYSTHSLYLSEDVTVSFEFKAIEKDSLNNGCLHRLTVYNSEGEIIFTFGRDNNKEHRTDKVNLNVIKDNFMAYAEAESLIQGFCGLYQDYELFGNIKKSEFENEKKEIINKLKELKVDRGSDFIKDCLRIAREYASKSLFLENYKKVSTIIRKTKEYGTFFYTPIWDFLKDLGRNNIRKVLSEMYDNGMPVVVDKVVVDFENSEFTLFSEFLLSKEQSYYEDIKRSWMQIENTSIKTFSVVDMKIDQTYQYYVDQFKDEARTVEVDFSVLYQALMNICIASGEETDLYCKYKSNGIDGYYVHKMHNSLGLYADRVLREVIAPDFAGNIYYTSSSRVKVERLYNLDNREEFSNVVVDYFNTKRDNLVAGKKIDMSVKQYQPDSFINYWIQQFNVGHQISLIADEEGLGVKIYIHSSEDDVKGHLLAEEGYGITQLVSILLRIETCILKAKGIKSHGSFGLELLDKYDFSSFRYENQTITIEEPEIHLHPRYQSLLADMFLDANEKYNIDFIVETHSEYLIRRTQVLVASRKFRDERDLEQNNPFKVYYLSKNEAAYDMLFKPNGKFVYSFGPGFFDVADNAALELFDIENS